MIFSFKSTVTIVMLFSLSIIVCDIDINGVFMECQIDQIHNHLSFDTNCFAETNSGMEGKGGQHNYTVLSKREYVLEEIGYECTIKKTHYTFIQDFFLNKYIAGPTVEVVPLTHMDCLTLITDQSCNKKPMNCSSNKFCNFKEEHSIDFPFWFGQHDETIYECSFRERLVVANNQSSTVVHDAVKECKPKDGWCLIPDGIVVWKTDSIRKCPFERIFTLTMNETENEKISIAYSKQDDLLFQMLNDVEDASMCALGNKLELTPTTQGVFLHKHNDKYTAFDNLIQKLPISKLKMEHFQEKDYRDLTFAENDSKFLSLKNSIEKLECSLLVNFIRAQIHMDDTFLKLNYMGNLVYRNFFNIINIINI